MQDRVQGRGETSSGGSEQGDRVVDVLGQVAELARLTMWGDKGLGGLETRVGRDKSPYPDKESEETDFIEWWLLSTRDREKELA